MIIEIINNKKNLKPYEIPYRAVYWDLSKHQLLCNQYDKAYALGLYREEDNIFDSNIIFSHINREDVVKLGMLLARLKAEEEVKVITIEIQEQKVEITTIPESITASIDFKN